MATVVADDDCRAAVVEAPIRAPDQGVRVKRRSQACKRLDGGLFSSAWIFDLLPGLSRSAREVVAWLRQRPPVSMLASALIASLLLLGVASFSGHEGWKQGLFVTLALLKGEYVDPVNVVLQ